jgi:hypothetical protein
MEVANMVRLGLAIDDKVVDVGVGARGVVDEFDSLGTGYTKHSKVHKARAAKHRLDLFLEMGR